MKKKRQQSQVKEFLERQIHERKGRLNTIDPQLKGNFFEGIQQKDEFKKIDMRYKRQKDNNYNSQLS